MGAWTALLQKGEKSGGTHTKWVRLVLQSLGGGTRDSPLCSKCSPSCRRVPVSNSWRSALSCLVGVDPASAHPAAFPGDKRGAQASPLLQVGTGEARGKPGTIPEGGQCSEDSTPGRLEQYFLRICFSGVRGGAVPPPPPYLCSASHFRALESTGGTFTRIIQDNVPLSPPAD